MYKDQKEALRRLEAELLMEEYQEQKSLEEELAEARELLGDMDEEELLYRNYSNGYGGAAVQAWSQEDLDEDDYEQEVSSTERKSDLRILTAVALALLAGIFCMLAYWAVRFF